MGTVTGLVGIGASAGGLEALQKLVASLRPDWPLGYVVAQHLSPTHTSMLRDLLARETPLTVTELSDGQAPAQGTIFIIPPNADAELADGKILVRPPQHAIGPKPSVDRLFASLAEQLGPQSVGIILSGTGGDGAKGLVAIKNAGGLAIVQDPASAKYSGMPNAALQDGRVDYVVNPGEMGAVLEAYVCGELYRPLDGETHDDNEELHRVIRTVFEQTGLDLSGYKTSTLLRRLQRRMHIAKAGSVNAYLHHLMHNANESTLFAKEVLISVTDFFRDPEAFKRLGEVLPDLIHSAGTAREIRIWNPGCATGEETYSLAILLEESMRQSGKTVRYKIFATDIDANAIATGRQGVYPQSSCETLPESWRDRYFESDGGRYTAAKVLRNNIVFSVHNLIQDPPFSRIDLISCRNLLIYFNNTLQKRILGLFNFSLNANGMLFLGRSESIEMHRDMFISIDKEARIFRKQHAFAAKPPINLEFDAFGRTAERPDGRIVKESTPLAQRIGEFALQQYAPTALVVNDADEIIYVLGHVEPYVAVKPGPTALNLFNLIRDPFRTELRALLFKCRREQQTITGGRHEVTTSAGTTHVRPTVKPLPIEQGGKRSDFLFIAFETVEPVLSRRSRRKASGETLERDIRQDELERQLAATQEHLQTVIEELETSNEELQSLTEELQSANEELQSTNEELQTSNEELQSTNEELLTVNDELEVKSRELETTLTDLQNVLNGIEHPLLVINKHMRVTRYVPAIEQLIERNSLHLGDSITTLAWKTDLGNLRGIVQQVMDTGQPYTDIVPCGARYYRFLVTPYHLENQEVVGAVLLFPDVTEVALAHRQVAESASKLRAVVDSVLVGIITIDRQGNIADTNSTVEDMFGYAPRELIGHRLEKILPDMVAPQHQSYIDRYLQTGKKKILGMVRELEAQRKDGTLFPIELAINELEVGGEILFTGVINDISKRKKAESELYAEQLRAMVTLESINDAVILIDELMQIRYVNPVAEDLTGWSSAQACGRNLRDVYHIIEEKSRASLFDKLAEQIANNERIFFHDGMILRRQDGSEYNIEQSLAPLVDRNGNSLGSVLSFHDITNRRQLLHQMTWQAQHDSLTGLVNRNEFEHRVTMALASANSFERQHALLYLDLDQFKLVNDTCGHHAGDELLRQLSSILASALRNRDTLARMGGDEFAVLLENCSVSQAEQIAEKLRELVEEYRFTHEDKVFRVGVSVGVVSISRETKDLAGLFSDADAACYAAKESGRNRVKIHSPDDKELEYKRSEMHWVARINQALDDNRLQLHFQAIHPLKSSEPPHWEALIRFIDEHHEEVLPGVFLPAAERYGLTQNLDRWVLTRVVTELAKRRSGIRPVVAINLSGSSVVSTKFFGYALDLFKQYPAVAEQICFEITETTAITNFSAAQEFMRAMKRQGCLFSLDDFGTGMSSFGYLKNLPVDFLKIDGVFVRDILHDEIDLFMVESINRIGQIMNIKTIAEFAESEAIIDKLTQIGVDYAQGYGVGRPLPLKAFLLETGLAAGAKHQPDSAQQRSLTD
jgi:two-component system CheB/CheR fusion protein